MTDVSQTKRNTEYWKQWSTITHQYTDVKTGTIYSKQYFPSVDTVVKDDVCTGFVHPGPPYREGGPVNITHFNRDSNVVKSMTVWNYGYGMKLKYDLNFVLASTISPYVNPSPFDLNSLGATGWNKFKPGKVGTSVGQFLGELRDVPRLFKFKTKGFRDLGSLYLSYQFGWRPFLDDLKAFCLMTDKLGKRYEYLRRNNGKWRKRGGTVKDESYTTVSTKTTSYFLPQLTTAFYNSTTPFKSTLTQTVRNNSWFEARMRFYMPALETPFGRMAEVVRLLGLYPSPALVYELMPWSWLADYFSNLGDVISNLSDSASAPNLVASYAYVMGHKTVTTRYQTDFDLRTVAYQPSTAVPVSLISEVVSEAKTRHEASPFGFGFNLDGLSGRQLAILGAMGINRWPKLR